MQNSFCDSSPFSAAGLIMPIVQEVEDAAEPQRDLSEAEQVVRRKAKKLDIRQPGYRPLPKWQR